MAKIVISIVVTVLAFGALISDAEVPPSTVDGSASNSNDTEKHSAPGGLIGAILNLPKVLMEHFKGMNMRFIGPRSDPTAGQEFQPHRAPPGAPTGGYTCKGKYCNMDRQGKKWNYICQIEGDAQTNHYHYCVPFRIKDDIPYKQEVFRAMRWYRENTCVAFVPHQNEEDFIDITNGEGCSSDSLGRSGGKQNIELGPGCYEYPAITFHEMMHALGYEHLHQNPNRDQYININFDNIDKAFGSQFKIHENPINANLTFNHDSVMLYGSLDFQKQDLKGCQTSECWTITTKNNQQIPSLYTKTGPTQSDIMAVNSLYDCSAPEFFNPNQLKAQRMAPLDWHNMQKQERSTGAVQPPGGAGGPGSGGAPGMRPLFFAEGGPQTNVTDEAHSAPPAASGGVDAEPMKQPPTASGAPQSVPNPMATAPSSNKLPTPSQLTGLSLPVPVSSAQPTQPPPVINPMENQQRIPAFKTPQNPYENMDAIHQGYGLKTQKKLQRPFFPFQPNFSPWWGGNQQRAKKRAAGGPSMFTSFGVLPHNGPSFGNVYPWSQNQRWQSSSRWNGYGYEPSYPGNAFSFGYGLGPQQYGAGGFFG